MIVGPRALALAVVLASSGVMAAEASPTLVQPAGVLNVSVSENSGFVVSLPRRVETTRDLVDIIPGEGTGFVWVGFISRPDPGGCEEPLGNVCLWHWFWWLPTEGVGASYNDEFLPGSVEVYIVTDGPVEVSIRLPGFAGERQVQPDGQIRAVAKKLHERCVRPCVEPGWGGEAHYLEHGYAALFAATSALPEIRDYIATAKANRQLCIYPDRSFFPGASPDPRDHPTGCDQASTVNPVWQAGETAGIALGDRRFLATYDASGLTYLGFVDASLASQSEIWGIWLDEGVH